MSSARNGVGRSEWTDNVRASTLAEAEPELEGLNELPPLWRELVVNLDDVFEQLGLRIDGGAIELDTTKGLIWEELAAALVRHLAALKLAFKLYSLIGSTDDDPNDMSQLQYLRFVKDAQIREHLPDVPPREQATSTNSGRLWCASATRRCPSPAMGPSSRRSTTGCGCSSCPPPRTPPNDARRWHS